MSEPSPQAPHEMALLLLGGSTVALIAAFLTLGPDMVAGSPALVWALLLLPVLVFTATARLLNPSVFLAVGILALGLLELIQPVGPALRWWMAGSLATILAAMGALAFRRRANRVAGPSEDEPEGPAIQGPGQVSVPSGGAEAADGIFQQPLVDIFLHKQLAAARRGEDLTVVLIHLDDFEELRDTHGQDAAEQLLTKVERSLHRTVRDSDVVGRYGERRFLTLLLGEDHRGGYMFADRVKRKISRLAVEDRNGTLIDSGVTVSAGIASFHEGIATPSELVEEARHILDDAVVQGGDRILVARKHAAE